MDKLQKEDIRKAITSEIAKTKKAIANYTEMTQPIAPENSIGRISRMDAINNKSVVEAALRQAKNKLKGLKFMITKVDDENFGLCARCGQPIPVKRILLMPESPYCVHCAG